MLSCDGQNKCKFWYEFIIGFRRFIKFYAVLKLYSFTSHNTCKLLRNEAPTLGTKSRPLSL